MLFIRPTLNANFPPIESSLLRLAVTYIQSHASADSSQKQHLLEDVDSLRRRDLHRMSVCIDNIIAFEACEVAQNGSAGPGKLQC